MAEICVTLARKRHRMLLGEMDAAVKAGARLLEIRLDFVGADPRVKRILEARKCPLVATVRRRQDGGVWAGDADKRLMLLRSAIVEGFDYVDLEKEVAGSIPRYGQTKRIVSHHDMKQMPEDLDGLYKELAALDADIVKIAARAHHPTDIFRMLDLIQKADKPTIGICMGDMGVASRILGAKYGSPFTYAAFNPGRIVAPGMVTFETLKHCYHYEKITEKTAVYGVIGDPIQQSLSPLVHNACFRAKGLDKVYVPFQVPAADLTPFMEQVKKFDIQGLSVTIPHKREIRYFGKDADKLSTSTQAANTFIKHGDDYECHNTDGPAALEAVKRAMPVEEDGTQSVADRAVLILGTGGVATTLAHVFAREGSLVTVTGRRFEAAKLLAEQAGGTVIDWAERHNRHFDIIINCTPMGMIPDRIDQSPFHAGSLKEGSVVFDTVYNPEKTLLLQEAEKRGCKTVSGMEMFVGQAEAQFRLFAETDPPPNLMLSLVREELSPAKNMLRKTRLESVPEPWLDTDPKSESESASRDETERQFDSGGEPESPDEAEGSL